MPQMPILIYIFCFGLDISETEYRVLVKLDIPDEDEDKMPSFLLNVRYPEEYPDVPPYLEIQNPNDAVSHPNFNVSEDRENLLSGLEETIQENIGMAMVFTLVSTLKDAAETLIQQRKDVVEKENEERLLAAEREENKKFQGTPVTRETFLKWRDDFMKEMEDNRIREEEERLAELKKAKVKEPVKLTGRQLWESGMVGKGIEEDEEDAPAEGVEKLDIKA